MKLNPNSTRPQIFKHYEHPWYKFLNKPKPPTPEAVEKAKFKDKTFEWNRSDNIRPRNKRSSK